MIGAVLAANPSVRQRLADADLPHLRADEGNARRVTNFEGRPL
jgi:hypothetical protein